MSDDPLKVFRFAVSHFGLNLSAEEDAGIEARRFSSLFGLPIVDGRDSIYAGPLIELMKGKGRGTHGHIGIATDDLQGALAYLEGLGYARDPASGKYDEDGRLVVMYLKQEFAGFAVHLLQRKERQEYDPSME